MKKKLLFIALCLIALSLLCFIGCEAGDEAEEEGGSVAFGVWFSGGMLISRNATYSSGEEVNVGSYKDIVFDIKNTGTLSFTLQGVSVGNPTDFSATANYTGVISPGETKHFTIRFFPASVGSHTTSVGIAIAEDANFGFTLTGTGKAAAVAYVLAPPSWIQGTWKDGTNTNTWVFSADNATFSVMGIAAYDFNQQNQDYAAQNLADTGHKQITATDTEYLIEDYTLNSWIGSYKFVKDDATHLTYKVWTTGSEPATGLTLIKQ